MKKVWSILAVLSMSLTALQAVETSVKQLSVDDFYKMKVYNNFDVSYRQSADSAGVIVIMASTEDISHVECVSKKGQLTIKYKGSSDKEQMQGAIIVYSTALEYVENNGLGSIQIVSPISGAAFQAKVLGNGSISAPQIDYGIVKASVLTGKGKISLTGKCRGVIGCHATQKLTAKATGNGEVYYRGTPEIKKLSLGELSVRSLEGK